MVASIRAPPGTPAPRQAQTETLSPTLSGDGLEAGRAEAVRATSAAIGSDGSKPVWASRPLQNPPQAQGWWCLWFPRAAPFHPQHWPLWSPGSRVLAAGTRGKKPLAVPSSGCHPPVVGAPVGSSLRYWGSRWIGASRAGSACPPFPEVLAVLDADPGPHQPAPKQLQHLCWGPWLFTASLSREDKGADLNHSGTPSGSQILLSQAWQPSRGRRFFPPAPPQPLSLLPPPPPSCPPPPP